MSIILLRFDLGFILCERNPISALRWEGGRAPFVEHVKWISTESDHRFLSGGRQCRMVSLLLDQTPGWARHG